MHRSGRRSLAAWCRLQSRLFACGTRLKANWPLAVELHWLKCRLAALSVTSRSIPSSRNRVLDWSIDEGMTANPSANSFRMSMEDSIHLPILP